jgi:predicted nucleic acid-binding protein
VTVFVDTSALYIALDAEDEFHEEVAGAFRDLQGQGLVTNNYVVTESVALVERRLRRQCARHLLTHLLAPIEIVWVDESIHGHATSGYLAAGSTGPSLVDFTSFEVMRRRGIRTALTVDRDFADAGFDVLPG